jgi:arylsulfatase A
MKAFLLATLATITALTSFATESRPPNIVIFLADDFGYGCVNSYGADERLVRTPHIDRLAAQGTRFTNAYTTGSVCSPTRYAMLTGEYSWRTAMKRGVVNSNDPLLIDPKDPTIASWLQGQGYQTAQVGKWHLGYGAKRFKNLLGPIAPGPLDVGFDYHFGVPNNLDDLHKIYIENDRIHGLRSDKISPYGKSFYGKPYVGYDAPQRITEQVMDTLVTKAIDWVDRRDPAKPFFLYFASVAVHHPITPSARMRGTSAAGAYGDFIHDVDHAMGQLQQALEARGLDENTLIIFTSDNGSDIPSDDARPETQAVAKGLAVNGTLRGDKHTIYEGGFKVPFIVRQPGENASAMVSDQRVSTIDIFATVTDIISGKKSDQGSPDGVSFKSQLTSGSSPTTRPPLVLRDANGRKALLFDHWKYIDDQSPPLRGKKPAKLTPELYDLSRDPNETNNVIASQPAKAKQARELLSTIRQGD